MGGRRQQGLLEAGHGSPLRRGESDGTATRAHRAPGETLLVPWRNRRSKVGRITGDPGKAAEGERAEDGPVVAMRRSNVRGARGPCCYVASPTTREAGTP